jgi:energy-coupling factor transporter ATP-binding protein EcfA2
VRPQSLKALSRAPESWGLKSIASEDAVLLLDTARAAITAQLRQDTAEAALQLESTRREHAQQQKDLEATQKAFAVAITQADNQLMAARKQTDTLHGDFNVRKQMLENKIRDLEDLLHKRGERLVALDLVDRSALAALIPPLDQPDVRIGHGYRERLGGDFAQLAPFIQARLWAKDILFSQAQLRDFLALMRTNDLVVLAGDSGSGKTSLVRAVAESIGGRCTIIPVKPNWTGPEDLLGYYNPIERSYQATPFLLALQAAEREPDVPHFICLDEMNLARVEHYFADFLSLLEDRDSSPVIPLYTSDQEGHVVVEYDHFLTLEKEARNRSGMADDATFMDILKNQHANEILQQLGGFQDTESVLLHHSRLRRSIGALLRTPCSMLFPSNVRIIGAVNIDETTHYLSPKVLDRAHVLRFRNPLLMDWDAIEAEVQTFDVDTSLPVLLATHDLGLRCSYPGYDRSDVNAALLTRLTRDYLDPVGVEFGMRAIRQSLAYLQAAGQAGIDNLAALDNVVRHKILPKLMLDTTHTDVRGRSKRDILVALRDALSIVLEGHQSKSGEETAITAMDQLLGTITSRNGIANYWLR